jgi:hypothetical protein
LIALHAIIFPERQSKEADNDAKQTERKLTLPKEYVNTNNDIVYLNVNH